VAKKSRRERREAQAARAVRSGDAGAIAELAEKSPDAAARRITEALRRGAREGGELDAPLLAIAADVAQALRRAGKLEAALVLASAGEAASSRLRLEHALAAFALGRDEEVAAAVAGDADVGAAVAPLLAAAHAVRGLPEAAPSARTTSRSGLARAAEAVARAGLGETAAAKRALARIPEAEREALLVPELGAALALAARPSVKSARAAVELFGGLQGPMFAGVRSAAAEEALAIDLDLGLEAAKGLELTAEAKRRLLAVAAARETAEGRADPIESALERARRAGDLAFAAEDRAAAALYEGFARLGDDSKRAVEAFDRAIQHGGDLVEALRGRLLASLDEGGPPCPDCGQRHRGPNDKSAAAADRLARALDRTPGAAPLAAAARVLAAEGWSEAGDTRAALAAIGAARPGAVGSLADDLDLAEARAVMVRDPGRARVLLEGVTERSPKNVGAWAGRIALAKDGGDRALEARLFDEATAATGDPGFAAEARRARAERGELTPYEGLSPGSASAGAVAAELDLLFDAAREHVGGDGALPPEVVAELDALCHRFRRALEPKAGLALDAARLVLADRASGDADGPAVAALVLELARAWKDDALALGKLAVVALAIEAKRALGAAARELAREPDPPAGLYGLVEGAVAAREPDVALSVLGVIAAGLPRQEVVRLRKLAAARARELPREVLHLEIDAVLRELDALLAPEASIEAMLAEAMDDDDDDDDEPWDERPSLDVYVRILGLPPERLGRLSAGERRMADELTLRALVNGDGRAFEALMKLLQRVYGAAAIRDAARRAAKTIDGVPF
jgi:hypothetical protein